MLEKFLGKPCYKNNRVKIEWSETEEVPRVTAPDLKTAFWGQGFLHGTDRALQVYMLDIIMRGRISELLDSSEESLQVDLFFRRLRLADGYAEFKKGFSPQLENLYKSYLDGLNQALTKNFPFELKLMGLKPWELNFEFLYLLSKVISYVGLASSQAEFEVWARNLVSAGISRSALDELFPGAFENEVFQALKKVKGDHSLLPKVKEWLKAVPTLISSNNWVVSGKHTESGKPLFANDPHLEINRLPNVWYESVLEYGDNSCAGFSIPGMPGIMFGRNKQVSWGPTYSYADAVDSWIEDCKEEKYLRIQEGQETWHPFSKKEITILRKKKSPHTETIYWNEHGNLNSLPQGERSLRIATQWASQELSAKSFQFVAELFTSQSMEEVLKNLGSLEISFNWVAADSNGNIGYQMSGLIPRRVSQKSGFAPYLGWEDNKDWQDILHLEELPRVFNPPEGFIVTANNDLNHLGKVPVINSCMGEDRALRIQELIQEKINKKEKISVNDFKNIQYDLKSRHAERFVNRLFQALPLTETSEELHLLRSWDFRFNKESRAAGFFETFYAQLRTEIFCYKVFKESSFQELVASSCIYADFFPGFDRIMESEKSDFFGDKDWKFFYTEAFRKAKSSWSKKTWGEFQAMTMKHLLLGEKLPRFFGFDRGPIVLEGTRDTPHQGQIFKSGGRQTSFAPSARVIADMATEEYFSNHPGGSSDRWYSKRYDSDVARSQKGEYRRIKILRF